MTRSTASHRDGCRCLVCRSRDPLDRLERYPNTNVPAPQLIREGAAEIRRLRAELAAMRQEATA
jgi:hypothetical protein